MGLRSSPPCATSFGLGPVEGSSGKAGSEAVSAPSRLSGAKNRVVCGVAGLPLAGGEIGAGMALAGSEIDADWSDPKKDCGDAMVPMYAGPEQGQFWQPLFQNFLLSGQCS
jgi:hypothetical protein